MRLTTRASNGPNHLGLCTRQGKRVNLGNAELSRLVRHRCPADTCTRTCNGEGGRSVFKEGRDG